MHRLALLLALAPFACHPRPSPPVEPTSEPASVTPLASAAPAASSASAAPVASVSPADSAVAAAMALLARMPPADPRAMDDENAAAARKVVETIVTASHSQLRLDECRMVPGTRAGQCLLTGSPHDTRRFIEGLRLPTRSLADDEWPAPHEQTCLARPDFGAIKPGDRRVTPPTDTVAARPGTRSFGPGTSLPPNESNVHVRRIYTSPSNRAVCLEFDYPYG